jgi:hypothetical protein
MMQRRAASDEPLSAIARTFAAQIFYTIAGVIPHPYIDNMFAMPPYPPLLLPKAEIQGGMASAEARGDFLRG